MYLVGHRHGSCLQHLIIKLFLLQLSKLIVQLRLVDRFANRSACDSLSDFLAQSMLLSQFLPGIRRSALFVPVPDRFFNNIHCLVNLINIEFAMDLLHSLARALHSRKSLSVDIRRLDRVYLLLQGRYLGGRLFKSMLMLLLSSQGSLGRCIEVLATVRNTSLESLGQLQVYLQICQ